MCPRCGRVFNPSDNRTCPDDGSELNSLSTDSMVGQIVDGKYRILEVVGAGGMSLVFRAEHLMLNRIVAVKMLHAYLRSDDVSVKRFQQEAKTCAAFDHPNVVPLLDFGVTEGGQPFLVMKYLDGVTLGSVLRDRHRLPWREAVPLFIQCCEGFEAAHVAGIIHRDIKPGNIVLISDTDGRERVQVVDFGIAKMLNEDLNQQRLTQAGEVFGSPLYMSPEQCEGRTLDARSDIYSLGAVMYEALSGEPPLMGSSATETMRMHTGTTPRPFAEVVEGLSIPKELEEIVQTMLAKAPSDRYPTMAAVRRKLVELMERTYYSERTAKAKSNRGIVAGSALAVVASLGTVLYFQGLPLFRQYRVETLLSTAEQDNKGSKYLEAAKVLRSAQEIAKNIKDHGATQSRVLSLLSATYEQAGMAVEAAQVEQEREQLIKKEVLQQYGDAATVAKIADHTEEGGSAVIDPSKPKEFYRSKINELENASILLLDKKDPVRAERLARQAVKLQQEVFGESDPSLYTLVRLERQLGRVYLDTTDFSIANDCFSKAMKLAEQHPNPIKVQVVHFARMGEALAKRALFEASERCYRTSLAIAEKKLPITDPCVPAIYRSYASVLKAHNKEDESDRMLEMADQREARADAALANEKGP